MKEYFIKNLVFFALTAAAFLVFKLVLSKAKFNRKRSVGNVLRYPLAYRLAPLSVVAYLGVVTLLVAFLAPKDWFYVAVSGMLALGALCIMISWSLWKVSIRDDGFDYRSCFGARRSYTFHEIELRESEQGTKWYFY